MAIERKDVKVYLDHDLHAQLKAICDIDGVGLGEFIERGKCRNLAGWAGNDF